MAEPARLIDITLPFSERLPVWPGDAPIQITRTTDFVTVSELRMSSHAGTHLDAPAHFIAQGRTVERLALETLIGPAWLAEHRGADHISAAMLEASGIPDGVERLLLKTRNSNRSWGRPETGATAPDAIPFDTGYIALDASAAHWLIGRGIRLIGLDGPSADPYGSDFSVHRLLLGQEVVIVENLDLHDVRPGPYRLICLPLPYEGGDGAPVRAVLETT